MALMTTLIKSILNGSKSPAPTHGEMKSALGTTHDFITELLGTDSANPAAARAQLGAIDAAGFRNLIMNPGFTINQRGWLQQFPISVSVPWTTGDPWPYFADRWRAGSPSATYSAQAVDNVMMLTCPDVRQAYQHIPAENIVGGTYQLKWEGTARAQINGVEVAKGATFTLPANTVATVAFFSGTVLRPQLERGSCGAWEHRPLPVELAMCMAFYEKCTATHYFRMFANGTHSIRYMVRKRAVPTVTLSGKSPTDIALVTGDTARSGVNQFAITSATGNIASFQWTADAEIYL